MSRGHALVMTVIGIVSVIVYLNVRHRIPMSIRRPLWIVVMAQAIAGLLLPAITVGFFVATILAVGAPARDSCWSCSAIEAGSPYTRSAPRLRWGVAKW